MSSYIFVELDRTPPEIEMYVPSYTTRDTLNLIMIESNEPLANNQEIYAIDIYGVRHDLTFNRESDTSYKGLVKFQNYPLGILTIYAKMRDEVDNPSPLISKSIEIKDSLNSLHVSVDDQSIGTAVIESTSRRVKVSSLSSEVKVKETVANAVKVTDKTQEVLLTDGVKE